MSLLIVADGKRASFDSMCHIYKTALVQIFGCELNLCLLISLIIPAYFFHRNVLVGVVDLLQNACCVFPIADSNWTRVNLVFPSSGNKYIFFQNVFEEPEAVM